MSSEPRPEFSKLTVKKLRSWLTEHNFEDRIPTENGVKKPVFVQLCEEAWAELDGQGAAAEEAPEEDVSEWTANMCTVWLKEHAPKAVKGAKKSKAELRELVRKHRGGAGAAGKAGAAPKRAPAGSRKRRAGEGDDGDAAAAEKAPASASKKPRKATPKRGSKRRAGLPTPSPIEHGQKRQRRLREERAKAEAEAEAFGAYDDDDDDDDEEDDGEIEVDLDRVLMDDAVAGDSGAGLGTAFSPGAAAPNVFQMSAGRGRGVLAERAVVSPPGSPSLPRRPVPPLRLTPEARRLDLGGASPAAAGGGRTPASRRRRRSSGRRLSGADMDRHELASAAVQDVAAGHSAAAAAASDDDDDDDDDDDAAPRRRRKKKSARSKSRDAEAEAAGADDEKAQKKKKKKGKKHKGKGRGVCAAVREAVDWAVLWAKRVLTAAVVLVALLLVVQVARGQSIVFCDTGAEPGADCVRCPYRGECSGGVAVCSADYELRGAECVPQAHIRALAGDLHRALLAALGDRYGAEVCGSLPAGETRHVDEAGLREMARATAPASAAAGGFETAFREVYLDFVNGAAVAETARGGDGVRFSARYPSVPLACRARLFVLAHLLETIAVALVVSLALWARARVRARKARAARAKEIAVSVRQRLSDNRGQTLLQEHLRDDFSPCDDATWELVQHDLEIDTRVMAKVAHNGIEQAPGWVWGANTPFAQARRGAADFAFHFTEAAASGAAVAADLDAAAAAK